jgi:hypothetical protein
VRVTALDIDRVVTSVSRDLATAGPRYLLTRVPREKAMPDVVLGALGGSTAALDDEVLELSVDGDPAMWSAPWGVADADQLCGFVDQIQDVVMETETEQWPMCPLHNHVLLPDAHHGWVAWCCPDTEAPIAELGELGRSGT